MKDYTIKEYSKIYLEFMSKNTSVHNYLRTQQIFKIINNMIGDVKLRILDPKIIQDFFDEVNKLKRTIIIVKASNRFVNVLKDNKLSYNKLRYELNIQHSTYTNLLNGKNCTLEYALDFSNKTKIDFELLFEKTTRIVDYSYHTKNKCKTYLRKMLAYAKRQLVISENYAKSDYVFYKGIYNDTDIKAMNEDQVKILYNTLINYSDIRIKTSLLVFLFTGFRKGEVAGLKWSDIDFKNQKITVSRSISHIPKIGLIIKDPKTKKSKRTITIPDTLNYWLKEYYTFYRENGYECDDYLFVNKENKLVNPDIFLFWLKKVLEKANLHGFTIHSLRHTNLTLLIHLGVPVITVAGRAGHTRTSTTTDIYSHFIGVSDELASKKLDDFFKNGDNELDDYKLFLKFKEMCRTIGIKDFRQFLKSLLKNMINSSK